MSPTDDSRSGSSNPFLEHERPCWLFKSDYNTTRRSTGAGTSSRAAATPPASSRTAAESTCLRRPSSTLVPAIPIPAHPSPAHPLCSPTTSAILHTSRYHAKPCAVPLFLPAKPCLSYRFHGPNYLRDVSFNAGSLCSYLWLAWPCITCFQLLTTKFKIYPSRPSRV